jgi:hypothetical protein
MTKTEKIDGIQHLNGNLYRVRNTLINFAENGDIEHDGLTFSNPRLISGNPKPKGLGKEEMNELREAIRTEGLENPLLLRWCEVNGKRKLQLVGGERRKRCLDRLISLDADCYDPATESWIKASQMYEYIDVRINEMDDQTAFKYAFSENDTSVGIGDGATIGLISEFRKADWTDDQILTTTGKSISWLRDTDVLLSLDEKTFTALTSEEINRSAALKLSKIEDIQERIKVLENAEQFAMNRLNALKEKLVHEVDSAEHKAEKAKADAVVAEMIDHDDVKAAKAKEKAEKAQERAEHKKQEIEELEGSLPVINSKDIHKAKNKTASSKVQTEEELEDGKALTNAKIAKHWYEPLAALISAWTGLEDEAEGSNLEIDLSDAKLVLALIDARLEGNKDIVTLLQSHKLAKDEEVDDEDLITVASLQDDEENDEENEEDEDE